MMVVLLRPISLIPPNHEHNTIISEHDTVNPFQVLQVRQDATVDEVRNHYRRLALWHHPGRKLSIISSDSSSSSLELQQRRAHVFCVLAACYETLVDYREEYNACLHNTTTFSPLPSSSPPPQPPPPPPPPLKGRVLVGGKVLAVFGSSSSSSPMNNHASAASWKPCCSTTTCEEEKECRHHDGTTTCHEDDFSAQKMMYHDHGQPLALLYRARHYTPFTDPFTVFEQAFGGRAIFERPKQQLLQCSTLGVLPLQQYNLDWECRRRHTPPAVLLSAWTTTKIEKNGSIVHIMVASRTLHGIQITKTETKTVDKEGKTTKRHIQVTSEPSAIMPVCARQEPDDFSCTQRVFCCCHCTKMNHDNKASQDDDDDELSLCSWPELSELSTPCKNWLFPSSE